MFHPIFMCAEHARDIAAFARKPEQGNKAADGKEPGPREQELI